MAQPPYKYVAWPSWRYDPKTGEGRIFKSQDEVPIGWSKDPDAHKKSKENTSDDTSRYKGFSQEELEHIVRRGGGRVKATDTPYRLYKRAEEKGLIANGQVVDPSEDGEDDGNAA